MARYTRMLPTATVCRMAPLNGSIHELVITRRAGGGSFRDAPTPGTATLAWRGRPAIVRRVAVEDDDEDLEDEGTPPPPRLAAAAEELLALATQEPRPHHPGDGDRDRLFEVLTRIGKLHELYNTHADFFDYAPTPVDDEERAWAAERELAFVRRCCDELAELAAGCVQFAVLLWSDLHSEWEDTPEARRKATAEARAEILSEVGILAERPRVRRLTAGRHEVAEFLRPTLLFAALHCADAAHELTDARFPGTAATTMIGLAASLLTDGEQIATAAGYRSWPVLGEDW